jgi:prophage DNA circulation protein
MSWTDSLLPASFRGVPFEALSASWSGGRRTVVHEIPDTDKAVTEDTGRKTRAVSFEAFLIGDLGGAWALIEALERGGPGLLVHPLHGLLTVNVDSYTQSDSWSDGDAIMFSLSFVEAGDLDFMPALSIGGGLLASVNTLTALASAIFDRLWSVVGWADSVLSSAGAALLAPVTAITDALDSGLGEIETAAGILSDLRAAFDGLPDTLPADFTGPISDALAAIADVEALVAVVNGVLYPQAPTYPGTPSQQQAARNRQQAARYTGRMAVAEACRTVQGAELGDYATAIRWRDTLAELLDAECEALTEDDADALDALRGLKAALVEDVTRRAALLPRVTTYTPPAVTPSLVVAWALYGDPERAPEIVARNRIVHPAFCPVEPLDVLAV